MRLEATDADSAGTLGAARHSRERLGSDENSAILIEGAFSVVSITRYLLNYFAVRLKNNLFRMSVRDWHDLEVPHGLPCMPLCRRPRLPSRTELRPVRDTRL